SGILHVVDFKTDQIVAAIQSNDYWDDKRHWELKNNVDMLDFAVFDGTTHSATLQQQNLVLKEVRDGRVVPYVITETEKNSDKRSITTYASGAWVQIAKSGIIKPQRIEGKTVNEFIDMALVGMKWKRGKTDYAGFHTMTIDEFMDPLTFLKKIASLFKLEIQYRVEVQGSQIVGWYVDMIQRRGRDTGKEIELGKDLIGVTRIEHSRDICTALVGFVKGEGDSVITIESINRGLPYIVDNDAFQRWNELGYATSVYANGITYVTFKAVAATSGNERKLSLYNYPSSTTKSIVEWVALYKGNKPQDWTAPPEEQVTTDEFTQKTIEITKSVDGIKETITKVENNQNGFDKRVATVEKDATTIKQNVSLIQNTQTEQGRQLQEAKAGWENTAKALQGKVELKQVEDYVAGFKIPELKQTVDKNKQDLLGELANKLATEQFNQKMTMID
ncbi:phage tail spike protein, partial [Bacillus thuringiensis]|uniref:phage tail spike protein n=1 Tax=Bacillus thuringiensis TaxID=1428 RepID=UPI002414474A